MLFFKNKFEQQLDMVIQSLEMNMSNNYKDNAQDNLKEFEVMLNTMEAEDRLSSKSLARYKATLLSYQEKMKGYTHKDQKPYWTF